jgi:hypothetical protein
MKAELFADAECWEFKEKFPDEFKSYGCGPGGLGDFLIPDTVWFLSIRDACRIHDWGYRHSPGCSDEDRKRHDRILLNNSLRIVDANTKFRTLKFFRYRRCKTYYHAVRAFGGPAYWSERNPDRPVVCES